MLGWRNLPVLAANVSDAERILKSPKAKRSRGLFSLPTELFRGRRRRSAHVPQFCVPFAAPIGTLIARHQQRSATQDASIYPADC
jgi:hypothetical protein